MPVFDSLSTADQTLPEDRWDRFVAARTDGHVLQTSRWAALKGRFGWRSERVAIAAGDRLVAGAQILIHALPWGQTLAYVPKGPLVDWHDAAQVRALLTTLQAAIRRYRPALLKLEPDLADSPLLDMLLTSYGARRGHPVQPRSTIHIPLENGLDPVLAGMKQKWRYNVRLAERKGVQVRRGMADDLPNFLALVAETGRRDRFGVHEPAYYRTAFELFARDDSARWLVAEHEGQMLAAVVVFALGAKSWYMWGASSSLERQRMPNHALQWAAMQWAFERGCQCYDLWGIPDEVGADPARWHVDGDGQEGDLWGVFRFKQGFGGQVVRYTGAWDLPLSPPGYRFYHLLRRLRR